MDYKNKAWMQPPPPVDESSVKASYDADVVILGAGHAGTSAARAAAEAGASVIVVEAMQEERFEVFGAQYGSINSAFARSKGVEEYDPVDIIADWQRRSLNRANPELIRKFAYTNGDTFDWFIEPLPQQIKDSIHIFMLDKPQRFDGELGGYRSFVGTAIFQSTGLYPNLRMPGPPGGGDGGEHGGPPPGGDRPGGDGAEHGGPPPGGGPGGMPTLTEAVRYTHELLKKMGVRFFYGVSGQQLEKSADGRVTGLIGRDYLKNYYRFSAKNGVILAAGDFSGSRDMVMDLLDEYAELTDGGKRHRYIPAGRNGSGVRMGLWAGGIMEPGCRGGMWACVAGNGGPMDGAPFLRLNAQGRRYTNEGIMGYWGSGAQGARQKGPICTIWDDNWRDCLQCQSLDHSAVETSPESLDRLEAGFSEMKRTGADMLSRPNGPPSAFPKGAMNRTVIADSIPALADKLGYSGQAREIFIASVARYNELCAKGRDEDFAKDSRLLQPIVKPPFYAFEESISGVGFLMVTVAGLWVSGDQQVLNEELDPIPGLYATGNCCGGRFPYMYTTPVAGLSIGMAYAMGRIVGDYVARDGKNTLFK